MVVLTLIVATAGPLSLLATGHSSAPPGDGLDAATASAVPLQGGAQVTDGASAAQGPVSWLQAPFAAWPEPPLAPGPRIAPAPAPIDLLAQGRSAEEDGHQGMEFVCPEATSSTGNWEDINRGTRILYGCPHRIYDTDYIFGNIRLMVYEDDPRHVAFTSLHGGATTSGQTERSRTDLTHTTFTTSDQGITWIDQPYGSSSNRFGEFATGTVDSRGYVYPGYLFSRQDMETGQWENFIGLFKKGDMKDEESVRYTYAKPTFIFPRASANTMPAVHLVAVPDALQLDPHDLNATEEEDGEDEEPQDGDLADEDEAAEAAHDYTEERVVASWLELARGDRTGPNDLSGWIDFVVSDTDANSDWLQMDEQELIGPCKDASNPVAWKGDVYVVCTVAKGYDHRPGARIGDHDLWRLDVATGKTGFMAKTGLQSGHPTLATNADGYMVVATLELRDVEDTGRLVPEVHMSFGWHGRSFTPQNGQYGTELHNLAGRREVLDAHITALEVTQDDKTVFMVYKEYNNVTQEAPEISIDDPSAPVPDLNDYNKLLVAFNQCEFPIAAAEMQLGRGLDVYNYEGYRANPGAFNDRQDGLTIVRDTAGTGEEVAYFAINDYGAAQFGAVRTESLGRFCSFPPPFVPTVPPVLPQALSFSNPATQAVAALLAVPLVAMMAYLLTLKRRSAHHVTAEDER